MKTPLPVFTAQALAAGGKLPFDPPSDDKSLQNSFAFAFCQYVSGWLNNARRAELDEAVGKPTPELSAHYAVPIPPFVTEDIAAVALAAFRADGTGWSHSCLVGSPEHRYLIVAREPYERRPGRGERQKSLLD